MQRYLANPVVSKGQSNVLEDYRERIEELRAYAEEDNLSLNPESEKDLLPFPRRLAGGNHVHARRTIAFGHR